MSYVLVDQQKKFQTDPLMMELSSTEPTPICFAGCPHAKEQERQQTFIHSCIIKRLPIVLPKSGLNFDLILKNVIMKENEVEFESDLILNGFFVCWKGSVNKFSLNGHARLELNLNKVEMEQKNVQNVEKTFEKKLNDLRSAILKR